MTGDWLDRFSAAGGARIHVPVGAGESAFERVLRETSGVYLLGVEPEVRIATAARGNCACGCPARAPRAVTVRHRQWVVVQ